MAALYRYRAVLSFLSPSDFQIGVKLLREQITSGARTVLLVLLAASGLIFIIACSNVANLILARTVRREGELAISVALGASRGALRRMLLAESLLLCGTGAALGVVSAKPMVAILARYASRFSVRAVIWVSIRAFWVGAALAVVAAVILAFVPCLPSSGASLGAKRSRFPILLRIAPSNDSRTSSAPPGEEPVMLFASAGSPPDRKLVPTFRPYWITLRHHGHLKPHGCTKGLARPLHFDVSFSCKRLLWFFKRTIASPAPLQASFA